MTLYILCGAGAVIIAALAYKIGQFKERLKNEETKTDSLSVAKQARETLRDPDAVDRLHDKFKR